MADAQQAAPATESKSEFARRCGVTPGRVSQWISEGKIDSTALDGTGPRAKVVIETALQQLRDRIDTGQRFGNGLKTRLDGEQVVQAPAAPAATPSAAVSFADRIQQEKLRDLEFRNRENAKKELASRGEYTRTADVEAGLNLAVSGMMNVFEGALSDFARALAARFEISQRDALHLLRSEFRTVRANAALAARRGAAELPMQVTDERSDDDRAEAA